MIELRLLGPIQLRSVDGHEVDAVLSQPKRLALLAYLAAARPRGFHRRDKLVALLWPELDQRRARQALNKAVHHLRQAIGDSAIVSRGDDELALDDRTIRCDVAQFENAVAEGRFVDALALYHGDLFDGLFVDGAAEFDQWLSMERERLRAVAAKAAGSAADATQDADLQGAIDAARRALAFALYDESALRRLMLLLERAGDRSAAVLAYNDFARRLRADLELEPSAEIRVLRESLNREAASPDRARVVSDVPQRVTQIEEARPLEEGRPLEEATRSPLRSRSRTHSRTLVAAVGATAFAGIVALAGWNRSSDRAADTAVEASKVFVAVLENRTGDSTLNVVGAMATDWIAQGLSAVDIAQVVHGDSATAGFVISGVFYKQGDSLRFQAQLSGAGLESHRPFEPVVAPQANPSAALESLRQQALSLVAQAITPREASLLRGSAKPPLYAAYREYILGMDLYIHREEERAYGHFVRAAQLDTTFIVALLSAAVSMEGIAPAKTDSLVRALAARREALSPVAQTWLDGILAKRREDRGELYRLANRLARELPGTFFPFVAANVALSIKRPREAAARLRSLDRHSRWINGVHTYWVVLSMADHLSGDAKAEESSVEAALRDLPDDPAIATVAVRFFTATGQLARADSLLDEARSMRPRSDWNAGSVFAAATLEATSHGHVEWAARVRERALRWYDQLPPADRDREVGFFGLTWILYSVGAWSELDARVARLAREEPNNPRWIAFQGIVAAQKRDTSAARRFDEMLATRLRATDTVIPGRALMLFDRARIAALLGERDAAIDLLREAFARGLMFNVYLHSDPSFSALRDYAPFVRLIAPIG